MEAANVVNIELLENISRTSVNFPALFFYINTVRLEIETIVSD